MPNPTNTNRRAGARTPLDHSPTRLRRRRVELGLAQHEVARRARISPGTLSELEGGTRNPSPGLLLRLAEALSCSTVDLMPAPAPATATA